MSDLRFFIGRHENSSSSFRSGKTATMSTDILENARKFQTATLQCAIDQTKTLETYMTETFAWSKSTFEFNLRKYNQLLLEAGILNR